MNLKGNASCTTPTMQSHSFMFEGCLGVYVWKQRRYNCEQHEFHNGLLLNFGFFGLIINFLHIFFFKPWRPILPSPSFPVVTSHLCFCFFKFLNLSLILCFPFLLDIPPPPATQHLSVRSLPYWTLQIHLSRVKMQKGHVACYSSDPGSHVQIVEHHS